MRFLAFTGHVTASPVWWGHADRTCPASIATTATRQHRPIYREWIGNARPSVLSCCGAHRNKGEEKGSTSTRSVGVRWQTDWGGGLHRTLVGMWSVGLSSSSTTVVGGRGTARFLCQTRVCFSSRASNGRCSIYRKGLTTFFNCTPTSLLLGHFSKTHHPLNIEVLLIKNKVTRWCGSNFSRVFC